MIKIIPLNDLRPHDEDSTTCDCNPSVLFENGEMIIVHNAFDGRQEIEEGGMEPAVLPPNPKK